MDVARVNEWIMDTENRNGGRTLFPSSLQETYEAKRNEFMGELQKKEEEMRQMFVQRVKEKEAELKEAEKEVPAPPPPSLRRQIPPIAPDATSFCLSSRPRSCMRNLTV